MPRKRPARRIRIVPGWSEDRGDQARRALRVCVSRSGQRVCSQTVVLTMPRRCCSSMPSLPSAPAFFSPPRFPSTLAVVVRIVAGRMMASPMSSFRVFIQTPLNALSTIHPTTAVQIADHKNNENSPASHSRQPSRTCFFCDSSSVGYHFWALCAGWTTSRVDEPNVFDAVLAADIVKKLTCRDGEEKKEEKSPAGRGKVEVSCCWPRLGEFRLVSMWSGARWDFFRSGEGGILSRGGEGPGSICAKPV